MHKVSQIKIIFEYCLMEMVFVVYGGGSGGGGVRVDGVGEA